MHVTTHAPGSFCWFELATSDQSAATRFYQSLLGWHSADSPMGPGEVYTMFKVDGRDAAAACTLRADQKAHGVPPNWLVYIAVESADRTATRAVELGGGLIAPPFDVMDHGRMAVLADPAGATFAIWEPRSHAGTGVVGEAFSVSWVDLRVQDQERAGAFYRQLFGWKTTNGSPDLTPAKAGDYYHIVNGSEMIGGIAPPESMQPHAPPHWLIYVEVPDCVARTAKAKTLGAHTFVENMQITGSGIFSVMADPQGAVFGIHQNTRP